MDRSGTRAICEFEHHGRRFDYRAAVLPDPDCVLQQINQRHLMRIQRPRRAKRHPVRAWRRAVRPLRRMSQRLEPPAISVQRIDVDLEDRRHFVGPLRNLDGAVRRLLAKNYSVPRNHHIAHGRYPSAPIRRPTLQRIAERSASGDHAFWRVNR
jgi:hypothetical protein